MAGTEQEPLPSTFMIKNLPSRWKRETVLEVINKLGFADAFDFFYVPRKHAWDQTSQSFGYAFINFKDPSVGQDFSVAAQKGLVKCNMRVATVAPANIQGVPNLKDHFQNKQVLKYCTAPVFEDTIGLLSSAQSEEKRVKTPAQTGDPVGIVLGEYSCSASRGSPKGRISMRWSDVMDD
eukprot:TRINITY_DN36606_c0_g1_i2.p1 TRINITY_DN36606_c0_g1~~TRINITY_DN36606_c0_g1_i2.p1  ORF type:complete len:205 (-),score=31.09 TRINITY_DN36606_c0_g1_i2:561-1097(-)